MGISPIFAIPKVLEQVGLKKEDIDVYEVRRIMRLGKLTDHLQINEAFASQFAYCVEELGIPIEKINPKCVQSVLLYVRSHSLQWRFNCHLSPSRNE